MQKLSYSVTEEIKELFRKSKAIALFIGAGVSLSSGIPTFRGFGQAKYFCKQNPIYLCSNVGLKQFPELAWRYFSYLYYLSREGKPSLGHQALVSMQKKVETQTNRTLTLITTNFDGLIGRAGGKASEIHGNISRAFCSNCEQVYSMSELDLETLPPSCSCGNMLVPDIVLLGDHIRRRLYEKSIDAIQACSLYVAIGTSGVNSHSYGLMKSVRLRANTTLIEVNPRSSALTKDMDYILQSTADEILPQLSYE